LDIYYLGKRVLHDYDHVGHYLRTAVILFRRVKSREPCQWLHSSGVLVHPLAVQRSPTDDFLLCLVSFSLLSGFCSQAHPEHMAERLQIPSGRLTFAKGYSTL
jgi:hypothetical protein